MAAFVLAHSLPAIAPLRTALVGMLGRGPYLALYSLVSIGLLAWVFHAAMRADHVPLWPPAPWQAWVAIVLSPPALWLILAGLLSPNPFSVTFRRGGTPGAITTVTRHPVLWGFVLWAAGHVLANGELRFLVLFGGLLLFSALGIRGLEARNRRRPDESRDRSAAETSIVPFAAIAAGRTALRLDAPMILAAAVAALLTLWLLVGGHAALFAADPLLMALG